MVWQERVTKFSLLCNYQIRVFNRVVIRRKEVSGCDSSRC
jgi:hypothetical protein